MGEHKAAVRLVGLRHAKKGSIIAEALEIIDHRMNEAALRHDVGFSVGWRRQGTVAILVGFAGGLHLCAILYFLAASWRHHQYPFVR
jgi:hypothetical protein